MLNRSSITALHFAAANVANTKSYWTMASVKSPISFFCHYFYFANWTLKLGTNTLEDVFYRIFGDRHLKLVNGLALLCILTSF